MLGWYAAPTSEEIFIEISNLFSWSPAKTIESFLIWSKEHGHLSEWIKYQWCAVVANAAAAFYCDLVAKPKYSIGIDLGKPGSDKTVFLATDIETGKNAVWLELPRP